MNAEFLLLAKFQDVDKVDLMDAPAQAIHDDYMERYGSVGALTVFVKDLSGPWDVAVLYEGPDESSTWLEQAIVSAAKERGGKAIVTTARVLGDITDRY